MISLPLERIDLRTGFTYESGSERIQVLPEVAWSLERKLEGVLWRTVGNVEVPIDWAGYPDLLEGRVLAFIFRDHTGAAVVRQVRIVDRAVAIASGKMSFTARGPEDDLATRSNGVVEAVGVEWNLSKTDAAKIPATCITDSVLPAAPTHFAAGTVTPTAAVTVTYPAGTKALGALLAIVDAANAIAPTGTSYEASVDPDDGAGKFVINITQRNVSSPVILVAKDARLIDLLIRSTSERQNTRIWMVGAGGRTIGRNLWKVSAVNTSGSQYVELQDLLGGPGPAWETDQWKDAYLLRKNGTTEKINGVTVASSTTTRCAVTSAASFTVGDLVGLVADSSGTHLLYVDAVAALAAYGRLTLPVTTPEDGYPNLFAPNADFSDWASTYPAGWSSIGDSAPQKSTTAGTFLTGGQSARFTGTNRGMASPSPELYVRAGEWVSYLVWLRQDSAPSGNQSYVQFSVEGSTKKYYFDGVDYGWGTASELTGLGSWLTFVRQYQNPTAATRTFGVTFHIVAGDVYVDAVLATVGSEPLSPAFRRGSSGAVMIQQANELLAANGLPIESLDVGLLDLYRYCGARWPDEPLAEGGSLRILYPPLNLDQQRRLVGWKVSSQNPAQPSVTLGARPRLLRDALADR